MILQPVVEPMDRFTALVRFSPKLQSRLPKESVEVEVVEIQSQEEEQSDDGSLPPTPSPSNSNSAVVVDGGGELTLVNSMKNFLFGKAQEKNDTKENENDASSESDGASPAADDKELRARLQDSAEIELYPRDPSGLPAHPVLGLETPKLASLVNIEHFDYKQTNV